MILLLRTMKMLHNIVRDNVRAIFMAGNISATSCTKYAEIRYNYINECVKDGLIKILSVRSAENNSDIIMNFGENFMKCMYAG